MYSQDQGHVLVSCERVAKKFIKLTCAISPTTKSPIWIWMASPFRITLNVCSPSIRSCSPRNCLSLDQSLNAVTNTTITTAIKMAAPSIHAWCSSSSGSSIKKENNNNYFVVVFGGNQVWYQAENSFLWIKPPICIF